MAILKIRDENGVVHEVLALRGEQGEQGERGTDAYAKAVEYGYEGTEEEFYLAVGRNETPSCVDYAVLVPTSWTASGGYYYQDVAVEGIRDTDTPIADIYPGGDNDANVVYIECLGKVVRIVTSTDSIRVWAREAISSAFYIRLKVVR